MEQVAQEPKIVSFVLRFVYEQPSSLSSPDGSSEGRPRDWHTVVRHIQSDTERRFSSWREVTAFISEYIELEDDDRRPTTDDGLREVGE